MGVLPLVATAPFKRLGTTENPFKVNRGDLITETAAEPRMVRVIFS